MKKYNVSFVVEVEARITISAENGREAIEKLETGMIDIEIVDGKKKVGKTTPIFANLNVKYITEIE